MLFFVPFVANFFFGHPRPNSSTISSMKSLVFALLLALQGVQVQEVAPNITGFSIQGTTVNLNLFKGKKPVLVVFYRTQA